MKNLLILILLLICFQGISQPIRMRTHLFASKFTTSEDVWSDWTEWQKSDLLINIDKESQRIKIFSNEKQSYDIISQTDKSVDKEGNPAYTFLCLDQESVKCKLVFYYNKTEGNYLIIKYSNLELMYQINVID